MEHDLLNEIYTVAHSPLVSGVALESLFRFFAALVQADNQIATHVVPNLVISAEKAPKAESSPSNVAKCIAQVVKAQHSVAAGTIAEYSKYLKVRSLLFFLEKNKASCLSLQPNSKAKPSLVILSLLIVGELGRFMFVLPLNLPKILVIYMGTF